MRNMILPLRSTALLGAALSACSGSTATLPGVDAASSSESWLQGTVNARLDTLAAQRDGVGITMWEVGYRYGELYFAGDDENRDYAAHQVEEIEVAMAHGLQRRPARAATAAMLDAALDGVKAAIAAGDDDAFEAAFETLTRTCSSCHAADNPSFIHIAAPEHRSGPVRGQRNSH